MIRPRLAHDSPSFSDFFQPSRCDGLPGLAGCSSQSASGPGVDGSKTGLANVSGRCPWVLSVVKKVRDLRQIGDGISYRTGVSMVVDLQNWVILWQIYG